MDSRQDLLDSDQTALELCPGLRVFPDFVSLGDCKRLIESILGILEEVPLYTPRMPRSGKPMSVRMSNCGALGWFTDKAQGYRYVPTHPENGQAWPPIPEALMDIWHHTSGYPHDPEACLINFYGPDARMGLHQDNDEAEFDAPVVSISLGDTARFRVGGLERRGATQTLELTSGTVVVLGGPARRCFHGVDKVYPETSSIVPGGGRFNLTLRRVTKPEQ